MIYRACIFVTLALASQASAQSLGNGLPTFNVNLNEGLSDLDFRLQLRIPNTPEAIRNQPFFTEDGREIHFRMLADPLRGIIIGTPIEGLEIELLHILDKDGSPQYVVIGRDNQVVYDLSPDDLFVTDLQLGEYCLKLEEAVSAPVPLNVGLAVDISGSMKDAIPDVRRSLADFARTLPEKATCEVVLFDHTAKYLNPPHGVSDVPVPSMSCAAFSDAGFLEQNVQTNGGGTYLVGPLRELYEGTLQRSQELNLLLAISDGAGQTRRNDPDFQELVKLRDTAVEMSGTYTAVNWLGNFRENYPLADLADSSLPGPVGSQPYADDFFAGAQTLLNGQHILTPQSCDE